MINQSHKSRQPPIVSLRFHNSTLTSSFTRDRTYLTSFESKIVNANKKMKNLHDPQEKEIMNDILNNGDPNGLVLLIQKLKKNITHLEIGGRVLEKKKKDTNLRRYLSINRTANELDKKLIRNMYFHANIE